MHRESNPGSDAAGLAAALRAIDLDLRRHPGHRLFTVLVIDWERCENWRIYSSEPAHYPAGGAKPLLAQGEFFRRVVLNGQARICADREACRLAFPDHGLLESLGCESAVNVPIRREGRTVGSLNLLHRAGWYREEMIPGLHSFADAAAALLPRTITGERP